MKLFNRRPSLTCQRAVELVTEYLDDALPVGQRRELERHLAGCANCSEYLRQIRATIQATGHVDSEQLTPSTRRDLIDLYRKAMRSTD